jgi:hypothetical protein
MAIIRFQTNITETFHLRSIDGKPVESNYGGMQYMFSAEEGTFYVSDKVGGILMQQFRTLGVQPGEAVEITKAEVGRGPERRTQWIVTKSVTVGEQTDGTLAVPAPAATSELEQQLAASIRLVEQRKQAQASPAAAPAWANFLVEQSTLWSMHTRKFSSTPRGTKGWSKATTCAVSSSARSSTSPRGTIAMRHKKLWWTVRWLLILVIAWKVIDQMPQWILGLVVIWWLYPEAAPDAKAKGGTNAA